MNSRLQASSSSSSSSEQKRSYMMRWFACVRLDEADMYLENCSTEVYTTYLLMLRRAKTLPSRLALPTPTLVGGARVCVLLSGTVGRRQGCAIGSSHKFIQSMRSRYFWKALWSRGVSMKAVGLLLRVLSGASAAANARFCGCVGGKRCASSGEKLSAD